MGTFIRIFCLFMTFFEIIGSLIFPTKVYDEIEDKFSDSAKASFSELYYELSEKGNITETWRTNCIMCLRLPHAS